MFLPASMTASMGVDSGKTDGNKTDGTENESSETALSQCGADKGCFTPECVASGEDKHHLTNKPTSVNTTPACVKERPRTARENQWLQQQNVGFRQ